MKVKFLLIAICILGSLITGYSQANNHFNPNREVYNTDPSIPKDNPTLYNADYKKNTFNWDAPVFNVNKQEYSPIFLPHGGASEFNSPFYRTSEQIYYDYLFTVKDNQTVRNNNPADGWEIIRRDFGYLWDQSGNTNVSALNTIDVNNNSLVYLVLYNKYSSIFRVIANIPEQAAPQLQPDYINISLSIDQTTNTVLAPNSSDYYKPTGIFAFYGLENGATRSAPLDKSTKVLTVSSNAKWLGTKQWFFADFILAYDPCTCFNPSAISIRFKGVQSASIQLNGRYIGSGETIANIINGKESVPNPVEYLTSLYDEGPNAKAGMIANANIQEVRDRYQSLYDEYVESLQVPELTLFEEVFNIGLKAVDKLATKGIASILGSIVDIASEEQLVEKVNKGIPLNLTEQETKDFYKQMKDLAPSTSFFSSTFSINKVANPSYNPEQPMLMMGEMTLKGNLVLESEMIDHKIDIANPGSLGSSSYAEFPGACDRQLNPTCSGIAPYGPAYTLYNEPLGVFSLLTTPVLQVQTENRNFLCSLGTVSPGGTAPTGVTPNRYFAGEIRSNLKLQNPIQFAFNPSVPVDESKTYIEASIILDFAPGSNFAGVPNTTLIGPLRSSNPEAPIQYYSSFTNINCINSRIFDFAMTYNECVGQVTRPNFTIVGASIKLRMNVVFKPDPKYPNAGYKMQELIVTYPLQLTTGIDFTSMPPPEIMPNTPDNIVVGWSYYTSSVDLVAKRDIKLSDEIFFANSNLRARYTAPLVECSSGPWIFTDLSPGVEMSSGFVAQCISSTNALTTAGFDPVQYCNNTYKANRRAPNARRLAFDAEIQDENESTNENREDQYKRVVAYPNPVESELNLTFIGYEESEVIHVRIVNIYGNQVLEEFKTNTDSQNFTIDVENLESGVFFMLISNEKNAHTSIRFIKN